MEKENTTMVLSHFVAALDIPLTRQTLIDDLQKHPSYNSLLGMSDVLDNWQVSNAAYNLSFDELLSIGIDSPFIAFVSRREFVLVNELTEKYAIVSNERWGKHRLSIDEFKNLYSGAVLFAEKDETSGETDYTTKHRKELGNTMRLPVVITGSAILLLGWLLFVTPYVGSLNWQIALLTFLKTTGVLVSVLLLMQSMDNNNTLIQKLCGSDNNKNCNAILSSKAAKITDELSWSEVGFFYFAGSWLVLLFNSNNPSVIAILALINVLALPYTFYSVYHQWKVAKQWCRLCCGVQALLWLEFFTFSPTLLSGLQAPVLSDWASFITGMAIPVLAWILIKPYLLLSKQIDPLKSQLRQYKYNKDLFDRMLNEEVQYALPDENSTIIIGNPEAEKVITMVSNPYCQPCAKAHKQLDWLSKRDDIKLQVVFTTKNETDRNAEVALHLMAMRQSQNDASLKKAMADWYEQKQEGYEAWAKVYPKTSDVINPDALEKQREWCKLTEVTGTPTLFLNGRRLPKNYQPEDIKYFI